MKEEFSNADWPKEEVQRLAAMSGKPLEVVCAQSLIASGWEARLGSYFTEGELKVNRELDVLAEKQGPIGPRQTPCFMRVLISCRGFPPERMPLAYSVSKNRVPSYLPRLLSSHRCAIGAGPIPDLECEIASKLLASVDLDKARPLVAFDAIERLVISKPKKPEKVQFKRCQDGDRQLFSAISSAVQAGFYWSQASYQITPNPFVAIHVPICVISKEFWDVCIDNGKVGEPERRGKGHQVNLHPSWPSPQEALSLIWCSEHMAHLVKALDALFDWLISEGYSAAWSQRFRSS